MRIFMYDDSEPLCRLVELWLEEEADLEPVGFASDREAALGQLAAAAPDVVVLDASPHGPRQLVPEDIAAVVPGALVLVYSGHPPEHARVLAPAGDAYLQKSGSPDTLVATLRRLGSVTRTPV